MNIQEHLGHIYYRIPGKNIRKSRINLKNSFHVAIIEVFQEDFLQEVKKLLDGT